MTNSRIMSTLGQLLYYYPKNTILKIFINIIYRLNLYWEGNKPLCQSFV